MPSFQLKSLKIDKFLTLQNTEIDFTQFNFPILILGMNLDLQRSNGAGKTTLLNAISYLKFGETITEVPADFYEGTQLSGILVDKETGQELYIERNRIGKTNHITAVYNDEELQGNTATQIQAKLNSLYGIKDNVPKSVYFQDYISTTYISNATIDTFASDKYTSQERMELICRMLDLEIWDRGIANAKDYKKQLSKDIEVLELNIKYITDNFLTISIKQLQKDCDDAREAQKIAEELRTERMIEISALEEQSKQYNQYQSEFDRVDFQITQLRRNYQQQVSNYNTGIANSQQAIDDAKKWLESIEDIHIDEVTEELLQNQQQLDNLQLELTQLATQTGVGQGKIRDIQKQIAQIDNQIKQAQTCPECNAELLVDSSNKIQIFDLSKAQQEKILLSSALTEAQTEQQQQGVQSEEKRKLIAEIKDRQLELRQKQQTFNQIEKKEELIKVNLDRIKTEYKNLEELETAHNLTIKQLCSDKEEITKQVSILNIAPNWKEQLASLKNETEALYRKYSQSQLDVALLADKIKSYEENIKLLQVKKKDLDSKKSDLSDYVFWIDGFSTIKRNLIDGFIPLLEQSTNDNIRLAGMDFTVALNTIKETKAGEARQKFNITVLDAQGLERPINSYSAGECKTMAICLALAIRDYKFKLGMLPFAFIMFDEVTDGLDEVGQNYFSELLKNRDEQSLVISHSNYLQNLFPSNITVLKQDGISILTY